MKRKFAAVLLVLAGTWGLAAATAGGSYRVDTVAGSSRTGDGGPAVASEIGNIQGIAVDRSGNLYLSDTDNHRVRRVSADGTITTIAGTGSPGFSGDGGKATAAQLNLPYGLAVDVAGAVYIADLGNDRVRRVGLDGVITTVAGTGEHRSGGDGGPAISAQLLTPRNVALDGVGNLYISEFEGHRIRKVAFDGKISSVAGTGVSGFSGDNGPAANAQISYPAGLTFDSKGVLYFADSQNNRVRKILANGTIGTALGGPYGILMATPVSVAVDGSGLIYVADTGCILHSSTASGLWLAVAGTGTQGFSGDGGPANAAQLSQPRDLALDSLGDLYIADGIRVRKVDTRGQIQTVAGDGYVTATGDNGKATDAALLQPFGVSLDNLGNLFIADSGSHRLREVLPASGLISTVAGTGAAGMGSDGPVASLSALNNPMAAAADGSGNIYVADTSNHRIRQITSARTVATYAGTGVAGFGAEYQAPLKTQLSSPRGICLDSNNVVYIVDTGNHRVLRLSPTALVQTAAGNGSPGSAGDGGQARVAQLNQPNACAVDSTGNLFIADTGGNRIRKVTPAGLISTVAGSGPAGSSGDEGRATSAKLNMPRGVEVDDSGNIFIADSGNHRIRLVTADGMIHTIAGQGIAGFVGDGGPATAAQFNTPAGLWLDASGNLYVADSGNNRIRKLSQQDSTPPPPLTASATAVNAASLQGATVAPGEIVTILGKNLGPNTGVPGQFDGSGLLPTSLGGVQVQFDGVLAPLLFVQANQINAQTPYTVAAADTAHVVILYQGQAVASMDLKVAAAAPGLFPVVVNQDGSFNTPTTPAARGSTISVYGTGEGMAVQPNILGKAAQAPYSTPQLTVAVKIGGVVAQGVAASSAAGQVGIMQVTASVPGSPAPSGGTILELSVGSVAAPPIAVWLK